MDSFGVSSKSTEWGGGHRVSLMMTLAEVNDWARGATEWRLESFTADRLLLIGGFDLCYAHQLELSFAGVKSINCPVYFFWPRFHDAGPEEEGGRRFTVETHEGVFEVVAEYVEANWVGQLVPPAGPSADSDGCPAPAEQSAAPDPAGM